MNMSHEDETDSFASLMQGEDVAPLEPKHKRAKDKKQPIDPKSQQQRRDAAEGKTEDSQDPNFLTLGEVEQVQPLQHVEWRMDGVQHGVFSKLQKGGYPLENSLDLHRHTVKEARQKVFQFLQLVQAKDQRCVIIATGKGEYSKTPGRLKSYTTAWLQAHPEVLAFSSAQKHHGGVGAMYVLVRKSAKSRELNREQHGQKSDDGREY